MLKCRAYYEYLLQGNILGNNTNVFAIDTSEGFTGAIVGNPLLNSQTGIKLFGAPNMYVFDNVIDMDFSAMYPNIIIAFNIERNTMYGKLYIDEFTDERYDHLFIDDQITDVTEDDDDDSEEYDPVYDAGKDFIDNYLVGDSISLGEKWFNLPNFEELDKRFKERFNIGKCNTYQISHVEKFKELYTIEIDEE